MIEVNLLGLITVIVVLLTHTVAIASVIIKHGNRIDNIEKWKCDLEDKTLPVQINHIRETAMMEARTRQMECTIANGESLEIIRKEIREVKAMIEKHLTIHETESKRSIYKSKQNQQ